jgi:hypothetical protein
MMIPLIRFSRIRIPVTHPLMTQSSGNFAAEARRSVLD